MALLPLSRVTVAPARVVLPCPFPRRAVSSPGGTVPLSRLCAHLHQAWAGARAQDPRV